MKKLLPILLLVFIANISLFTQAYSYITNITQTVICSTKADMIKMNSYLYNYQSDLANKLVKEQRCGIVKENTTFSLDFIDIGNDAVYGSIKGKPEYKFWIIRRFLFEGISLPPITLCFDLDDIKKLDYFIQNEDITSAMYMVENRKCTVSNEGLQIEMAMHRPDKKVTLIKLGGDFYGYLAYTFTEEISQR